MQQQDNVQILKYGIVCLLAGAASTLAFAPFTFDYLVIFTLAILFYCWCKTTPITAFLTGYLFGLGFFGTGLHWLHISINLFGGISLPGAYFLTYLLVAFLALYPALTGYISRKTTGNPALLLLICIPATWVLGEWLRGWLLTGFPWLSIGYSQIDSILSAVAPVLGVYGVSWIVCFISGLLVLLTSASRKLRLAIVIVFILVISIMLSLSNVHWTHIGNNEKSVALVQGAIPQAMKWRPEQRQRTIELYTSLTKPYWNQADLIIWPETAIPMYLHQAKPLTDALQSRSHENNTDLMTGFAIKDTDKQQYFNSIVTIGREKGIYHKRHLVPFGEYLPFDNLFRPLLNMLSIPMSDFSTGSERPLLNAAGIPVGVSICFEDVFGEEVIDALPEAMLLINISNDAWFGDSVAPHQHLQIARMRSKETGRYLLRSTNTGISAIINEQGGIVSRSPQFEPDVLSANVKTFTGHTPYSRYGNWPVVVFTLLLVAITLVTNRRLNISK